MNVFLNTNSYRTIAYTRMEMWTGRLYGSYLMEFSPLDYYNNLHHRKFIYYRLSFKVYVVFFACRHLYSEHDIKSFSLIHVVVFSHFWLRQVLSVLRKSVDCPKITKIIFSFKENILWLVIQYFRMAA